jgi:opacity protein-like surface antigen
MRKLAFFLSAILVLAEGNQVRAQECCHAWEVFGGYAYLNSSPDGDTIISDQFNNRYGMNGFGISLARNLSNKLGIAGEFSINGRESTIGGLTISGNTVGEANADLKAFTFLFGPRFSARSDGSSFFVHAMAGAVRRKADVRGMLDTGGNISSDSSSTDFALGLGGGADVHASERITVRLFQFDYIPVRARTDLSDKAWSHNYRLQTGIVVRWGFVR